HGRPGGIGNLESLGGQRLRLGAGAVVADDGVAGGEETLGHGASHGAQADESDRGHQPLLGPLNWNIPPPRRRAILPMPSAMRSVVGGMSDAVRRSRNARSTG